VLCHAKPSVHADHWPIDKKTLIARGLDSNDPKYGRGLCAECHNRSTALEHGGFGTG
jgi:5-methylcytosine-specific restriction protein A